MSERLTGIIESYPERLRMSLQNDLGVTERQLENASQPLQERILEKYSRLKALDLLTGVQAFRRDSKRLDATTRAVRRKQGLKMSADPEDEIVLGDKITQTGTSWPQAVLSVLLGGAVAYGALKAFETPQNPVVPQAASPVPLDDQDTINRVQPGFGQPQRIQQREE